MQPFVKAVVVVGIVAHFAVTVEVLKETRALSRRLTNVEITRALFDQHLTERHPQCHGKPLSYGSFEPEPTASSFAYSAIWLPKCVICQPKPTPKLTTTCSA